MGSQPILSPEETAKTKVLIIEGLSLSKSIQTIINEGLSVKRTTIYTWLNNDHDSFDLSFANNYARAREEAADFNADQIEEIADKTLKGKYDANAARVAIDALKWIASKKQPTKYGDRIKQDITIDIEAPLLKRIDGKIVG